MKSQISMTSEISGGGAKRLNHGLNSPQNNKSSAYLR